MECRLKNVNWRDLGKRTLGIATIPLTVVLVVLIVCASTGTMIFQTNVSFYGFTRYAAVVFLTTLALSINLGSGRFDFSLGSIATLSSVISAKITYAMLANSPLSAFTMLVISLLVGSCLGALSGLLYVSLRLPPIITSLGVTLIFEGITFVITSGKSITTETDNASMTFFREAWWLHLLLALVVLVAIYFLFDRSRFGYKYKSLREGQKISTDTGIKEVPNALICYAICGGLMGLVGFLQALPGNMITTSVLNFGSIGIMFSAFLPMFVGGFIGRYSNDKFGYLVAALCMSLLSTLFSLFKGNSFMDSVQSIVTAVLLVAFLIFLNNEDTCKSLVDGRFFKRVVAKFKKEKEDEGLPQ